MAVVPPFRKLRGSLYPLVLALGFALVLFLPRTAFGQGCSMCRDTTAGSAPQIRSSLRRAIPMLGVPAVALFCASLGIAYKLRH